MAVPLSLVGTFGGMYLCGYSLDNLSLMALTISTGFVVDDAIVVLENITRYVEEGERPLAAAFRGAREIGFTVLSMTISLVSVFIPILLMGGLVGRLFREFAVTLTIAVTLSLIVSLSVTPMMCSRFLRSERAGDTGGSTGSASGPSTGWPACTIGACAGFSGTGDSSMLVTFATICLNVYLYTIVPKGLFPQQDVGRIVGAIQAEQDISSDGHARQDAGVRQHGDGRSRREQRGRLLRRHGQSHEHRAHVRRAQAVGERKISVDLVIQRLRGKLAHVPGATLFLQAVQDVRVGGRMSNAQYQYTLQSTDLNELNSFAPRMLAKLRTVEGLRDVATDQQNRGLQASLVIDRDTASRLGILPQLIDNTLYDAFGQRQVSNIYTPLNQYHVVLEVPPAYQQNPDALKSIYVKSSTGSQVPLSAFAHFSQGTTPLAVNHQGFFPAVTLSFNLAPGFALGDAVVNIQAAERQMNMPASIRASFQGTAQAFQASLASQPILILAAIITVYIVLGVLYESFIHPITILSTLPSAGWAPSSPSSSSAGISTSSR
mgnify:CR=1 FL=1